MKRRAYFIQETVKTDDEYVVCIAQENTKGFYRTDWTWGNDKALAQELCDDKNAQLGLSEMDVQKIIISTMWATGIKVQEAPHG